MGVGKTSLSSWLTEDTAPYYTGYMNMPILSTKLYMPQPRPGYVPRFRLTGQLQQGLHRKLSLISAPAGYGKTSLVSEWLAGSPVPSAWLSLDDGDNDPARFLSYLLAALRTLAPELGEGVLGALQTPQTPPVEWVLSHLLNEWDNIFSGQCVLVLDDYHVIDSRQVLDAVGFLLERLPHRLHLVITTRTEPELPLSRLRARDQLTEVRAADLRFRSEEAAEFLSRVMGLKVGQEGMKLLEAQTEGWIAGLQLAALSIKGQRDVLQAIQTFNENHPFVLDYLAEEALNGQDTGVRSFLLRTSILDRMSGPLCDVLLQREGEAELGVSGQAMLERLERSNLFIVPLDAERRWFRYHHLFVGLLRKRLQAEEGEQLVAELQLCASRWHEENGFELEAFHHAVQAGDVERAALLAEGGYMPLFFRGAAAPVLAWLGSLPKRELDTRPSLWVMYASAQLIKGELQEAVSHLEAAERALQNMPKDERTSDAIGHAASIRATLAVSRHDAEMIMSESRRALAHLHPDNRAVRTATTWTLGYAYQLQGERAAAGKAYSEALTVSQSIGHGVITLMSMLGLGAIRQSDNQLHAASDWYRRVLELAGDPPIPAACEAHLGLASIYYEWNDLEAAEKHAAESLHLAPLLKHTDRIVACKLHLARVKLARNRIKEASVLWSQADQLAKNYHFTYQMKGLAAVRTALLLRQLRLDEAARLLRHDDEPTISLAKVQLANGNVADALSVLAQLRDAAEASGRADELLQVKAIQAVALYTCGSRDGGINLVLEVLDEAEGEGFARLFLDEGPPMERLLLEASKRSQMADYIGKLLVQFKGTAPLAKSHRERLPSGGSGKPPLVEPLSSRELEVLELIADGLSNTEIASRLFLALSTVKGHNRIIFDKLQVSRRTEAVARARGLGLL
ncbi:LuxR C-terminal-related transcriptional regulator [Paenibacillus sp. NPDC057967]|uniref:LuxR C-terminal-related transcriptional regulator n=1 Tax=Paenibacillus sp. NPDC057967 TaxID=3346293 RepID=UPI0036DF27A1